jgi:hypothetical protein
MEPYHMLTQYASMNKLIYSFVKNIDSGLLFIKTFTEFDNRTIYNVQHYLQKNNKIKKYTSHKNIIKKAIMLYDGWIYSNTIYYKDTLSNKKLLSTLIHEYIHYIRKKEGKFIYNSSKNIFIEECIAELSSIYVINNIEDKYFIFDDNFLENFINDIISDYNLNLTLESARQLLDYILNEKLLYIY